MKISKDFEFDMAHRLPNHSGLCKNLHGHRYKVRLTFVGPNMLEDDNSVGDADEGMVVDFHTVKKIAKTFFDETLGHGCMLSNQYDSDTIQFFQSKGWRVIAVDFVPTAENMAEWMYNQLVKEFRAKNINLRTVTVWETPTAFAEYKNL
jgi:6-pyruvoyltetrahydropterin/6-carboxytetrahydropterin synthase